MENDDSIEGFQSTEDFLGPNDIQLLILVDAIAAAITVLDQFLDPRRKRLFLRSIVSRLENLIPLTESMESEDDRLNGAFRYILASHWVRATGELGEIAQMTLDYPEAVSMFRRSLRVWARFAEQSRLNLAVQLAYVAALAEDVDVCLDALALCDCLPGTPTHNTVLIAARQLAAVNFVAEPRPLSEAELVARLRL